MAASVAPPEIAPHDYCSGAEKHAARLTHAEDRRWLRDLPRVRAFLATAMAVHECIRGVGVRFPRRPQRPPRRAPLRPSIGVYRQPGRNGGLQCGA
ncbi:hypothetical protein MTO96_007658 [Rhipicephalus appendiculatus]